MEKFNSKEMYEACFKATGDMKIGNRNFEKGEPFLHFSNLKLSSTIKNQKDFEIQRGGKSNLPLVFWQETNEEVELLIEEGTLSTLSFTLLSDAKLIQKMKNPLFFKNEEVETDSAGEAILSYSPNEDHKIFVYHKQENSQLERITDFTIDNKILKTDKNNEDIFISYYSKINNLDNHMFLLGYKEVLNTFFDFEGKMYYQNEDKGENKTCLVKMPKVKILSSMYVKVGSKVNPTVANFKAVAFPLNRENGFSVMMRYLDKDIDGDI